MDYVLSLLGPLAQGATVTLKLFAITLLLAVPLGLVTGAGSCFAFQAAVGFCRYYIWLMRGTPLMLQMLFIYFALPFVPVIGVRLPDFPAAVVAFALNYAAYFAEIFRAGILSVDRGQYGKLPRCLACRIRRPCAASCYRKWYATFSRIASVRGWVFVSPTTAFEDPLYTSSPDTLPAGGGVIWASAKARGVPGLRYPAEDSVYEEPSSARRHCCLRWEGQVGIELQMPINRWATAGRL